MDHKNELELKRKYPNVFKTLYVMPEDKNTPFHCIQAFGLECGNGWYDLIDRCSARIEAELMKMPEESRQHCYVNQIKEKFGTLRYYMSSGNDTIWKIISEAEEESAHTCENCGAPGETLDINCWYVTLCGACEKTREERRAQELIKWKESLSPEERARVEELEAEEAATDED